MTEARRIALNVAASYGRNLFALVCGLFAGRWALMALGEVDYGLFGVVGGLMVFIGFFNGVLAGAIGRYYAIAQGQALAAATPEAGLDACRRWFNTALSIHTVVPAVLLALGYPLGVWAVREGLTIPPERVEACVWVFRFACLSGFVGMVNVPFSAMFAAKQRIAELTVFSVVGTAANVAFLYYMVTHPGVWLAKYALWTCLLSVVPQILIALLAFRVFPECRVRLADWYDGERLAKVAAYAGWQLLGTACGLLRTQGFSVLVNVVYGPRVNTAQTVAASVNGHASGLAGAMLGAFMPAITTACGSGDRDKMRRYAFRACKFGLVLALLFMLPLALELPEVMRLWLKHPPEYAVGLCWCMLALYLADVCTQGHMIVVNASGRIAAYQTVLSLVNVFMLPVAWLCMRQGLGVYLSVGGVMIGGIALNSVGRALFARALMGMSLRRWVFGILTPIGVTTLLCGAVGALPRFWMAPSLGRIFVTGAVTEAAFLPCVWFWLLDSDERAAVSAKVRPRLGRLGFG